MARETVGVDVDDVLAAHIEAFIAHSNNQYGTALTPNDYNEHWAELWGVDREEVEKRALEFHRREIVGNFGVIEEAEIALWGIKRHRDLVVVTARPKHTMEITLEWIGKHFSDIFSDVHFVPIWEPDNTVTKADICQNIGANYLIDDLVRHCNLAAEAGIKPILFQRHNWSQGQEPHPDVVQVKNWREVLEYFDEQG